MRKLLEEKLFPYVIKPGRYCGGEPGQIVKDPEGRTQYLHCYPDKYELGQSYVGLQSLYHIVNADDRFLCERAFAVDIDAEEIMRRESVPLFSLESSRPAMEFDAIGFTLVFELVYTNMLAMLDLAGIPLHSKDRDDSHPLILAGGPAVFNPEPIAPFVDLFFIGDAEEGLPQILSIIHEMKGQPRRKKLEAICKNVESVYIPEFYDGNCKPIEEFAPGHIQARQCPELKPEYYPAKPILPLIDTIHDHLAVEIMRGCPQGCRFCQAGPMYRPLRVRPQDEIMRQIEEQMSNTGYDGVALMSLSSSDYPGIDKLATTAARRLESRRVSISLPALRPGTIGPALLDAASRVRKSGLTLAPEAGSERLRLFIRKDFPDEAIYDSVRIAYSRGWTTIKLYFMVGLPTETDDDLVGIADLIHNIYAIGRQYDGKKIINVTLSPFVPKPHTPFQWDEMCSPNEIDRKIKLVKRNCRNRNVNFKYSSSESSILQCVLGRGGREMAPVILDAFEAGCRFDGWSENLKPDTWFDCLENRQADVKQLVAGLPFTADLPWSIIKKGVSIEHLQAERQRTSAQLKNFEPRFTEPANNGGSGEPALEFGRGKKRVASRNLVAPTKNKIRLRWGKNERYRYMSHLDNIRFFERAVRRADIPANFSQGFNPSMKLSFGPPLPLGFTSETEIAEITLSTNFSAVMIESLRSTIPEGIEIYEARIVLDKAKSLTSVVNRMVYSIKLDELTLSDPIGASIADILTAKSLPVERSGKKRITTVDLRPGIYDLRTRDDELVMELGVGEGVYVRPTEVLTLLEKNHTSTKTMYPFHRESMLRVDELGNRTPAMEI